MDNMTDIARSYAMSRVKNKNTSLEVMVRKFLFRQGLRYRKNVSSLPGRPDIVLPKYKAIIFVNGCFWHEHSGCPRSTIPKTNEDYWIRKLNRNRARDRMNCEKLYQMKWHVIIVWECELKKTVRKQRLVSLLNEIKQGTSTLFRTIC